MGVAGSSGRERTSSFLRCGGPTRALLGPGNASFGAIDTARRNLKSQLARSYLSNLFQRCVAQHVVVPAAPFPSLGLGVFGRSYPLPSIVNDFNGLCGVPERT